ncbi:MAG TPA: DUF4422 domain-containing protein [Ignavibacteriales bacterium]|nr:DUF4422 domain-containing protein [Ignavibacteriales bacterium]HOL81905.1 DUF4422 domain-containing protein [Ignavibacteriales bacterium]HOM65971.1 DUF4422 domain-containing protein [Ignavibacteriales bacterium]HPD67503.1 DUF4422 domain-containing protein [Ignavibacteriales bacterium]HPP34042.1 DUF4422 domain-containing protein [Ignavibacteriales bacterium]
MNNKIKIFVVYHKEAFTYTTDLYQPIQAGCDISNKTLNMLHDNTGNNISKLNDILNEYTALYWVWQNYKCEYIGLNHYRRYFFNNFNFKYFHKKIKFNLNKTLFYLKLKNNFPTFESYVKISNTTKLVKYLNYFEDQLKSQLIDNIIFLAEPYSLGNRSVYEHFAKYHSNEHIDILYNLIKNDYPDFFAAFDKIMKQNYFSPFNMFICKWEYFDEYMNWIIPILNKLLSIIQLPDDPYQKRSLGFLAERLFNVFWEYKKNKGNIQIKYLPVLFVTNV